jgi:hypothetical protein
LAGKSGEHDAPGRGGRHELVEMQGGDLARSSRSCVKGDDNCPNDRRRKKMKWLRLLFFVVLALGVAPAAVGAQDFKNHSLEPGSVLIFPEFLTGTVDSGDGTRLPRSAFEISVVCPPGTDVTLAVCTNPPLTPGAGKPATVFLKAKWVCPPATSDRADHFCAEKDFILTTTVNGTLWINPENIPGTGVPQTGPDPVIPQPLCPQGFFIVWVINNTTDQVPINFNGLLGDAVLRPTDATHTAAYNAVAISTNAGATTGLPVVASGKDNLEFQGDGYRELYARIFGTVRYDDATFGIQTFISLVPLDIDAGTNNSFDNFVHFDFYDENEDLTSADVDVKCYREVSLSNDLAITAQNVGGLKGLVKVTNTSGYPIVGIIETQELIPASNGFLRGYAYSMYDDRTTSCEGPFNCGFFQEASDPPIVPLPALTPPTGGTSTAPAPPAPTGTTSTLPGLSLPSLPTLH